MNVGPCIAAVIIARISALGFAQSEYQPEPLAPIFSDRDDFAIRGFDPVAYFTDQKAVKGDTTITYDWRGATWLFTNTAHREAFAQDPEKYAPQYGGY